MPDLSSIEPKTTAVVALTVKQGGVPETGATLTANIFNPFGGVAIASNVSVPHQGSGVFNLTVLPAWSTGANGEAVEGIYVLEVKAVAANSKQRVRRYYLPILYQ